MRRSFGTGLAALTVVSAAVLGAAPAQADETAQRAYLNALQSEGIIPQYYTPEKALASARTLCTTMDRGVAQVDAVDVVINTDGLPENAAAFVVGVATVAFCPWNSSSIR